MFQRLRRWLYGGIVCRSVDDLQSTLFDEIDPDGDGLYAVGPLRGRHRYSVRDAGGHICYVEADTEAAALDILKGAGVMDVIDR